MKKLISLFLAVLILTGAFCITSTASGALIFRDDFDEGMRPTNWVTGDASAFFNEVLDDGNGVLAGYNNAKVLQSKWGGVAEPKWWDKYYATMDVNIRDLDGTDDSVTTGGLGMWYRDLFEDSDNGAQGGPSYMFWIDVTTGVATLEKSGHDYLYTDENGVMKQGHIDGCVMAEVDTGRRFAFGEWEEEEWFNMGMRVTEGKIECFLDQECIITRSVDDATEWVGPFSVDGVDPTVGSQKSAFLVFNSNLYFYIDNFEVWEPGYADDFKGFVFGDANFDGTVDETDVVAMLRYIAGWETAKAEDAEDAENSEELGGSFTFDFECADVDLDGEVTLRDAVLVMQHLAGWRVTLGQEQ